MLSQGCCSYFADRTGAWKNGLSSINGIGRLSNLYSLAISYFGIGHAWLTKPPVCEINALLSLRYLFANALFSILVDSGSHRV